LRASQFDASVKIEDIVDVDIVWGEKTLGEAVGSPVDYVVASHVIEHVPDLIGWLLEVRSVLKPGGILGLAVPDRRFTFDYWRTESGIGEMVEAYLLQYRRPSLRQIFDASLHGVPYNPVEAGSAPEALRPLPDAVRSRMPEAYKLVKDVASNPRYVDAHCWVFTPQSFVDALDLFNRIGLFPYKIDAFFPTEPGQIEFQVRLRAIEPGQSLEAAGSIERTRSSLVTTNAPLPTAASKIHALEQEVKDLHQRLAIVQSSRPFKAGQKMRALLTRLSQRRAAASKPS
jgi:hypothetical protein